MLIFFSKPSFYSLYLHKFPAFPHPHQSFNFSALLVLAFLIIYISNQLVLTSLFPECLPSTVVCPEPRIICLQNPFCLPIFKEALRSRSLLQELKLCSHQHLIYLGLPGSLGRGYSLQEAMGKYGKGFPSGRESKDHSCRKVATSLHDVVFLLSKKIK